MKRASAALLLILLLNSIFAQENPGIHGTVTDSQNGKGISGIHIWINENQEPIGGNLSIHSGITKPDGSYFIPMTDSGFYFIHCSGIGFRTLSKEYYFAKNQAVRLDFQLETEPVSIGEVSVTALHMEQQLKEVPVPVALVTSAKLNLENWNTMSDVLASQAGVTLSRDGIWATSVNIRGLSEQRLVTLIDGARVETATDIAGAYSMISPDDIERIEIVKGAASAVYGTGALGGVINIHTRQASYSSIPYVHGRFATGWNAVNNLAQGNLFVTSGGPKWNFRLSGGYRQAGDMKTPNDTNKKTDLIKNSGFKDQSISGSLAYRPVENKELKIDWQLFHGWDIGIPGGKAFPATATATYTRADRNLLSATYTVWNILPSLKKLQTRFFMQDIRRDVELKPSAAVTISPVGKHYTSGLQLNSEWEFGYNHKVIIGLDAWQRNLTTSRTKEIKTPLKDSLRGELPIPASSFTSAGIFAQDEWTLVPDRLKLQLGARGDNIRVQSDKAVDLLYTIVNGVRNNAPARQRITFDSTDVSDFSWSTDAGLLYSTGSNLDFSLSVARGYRAPSLEERFKYIDLGSFVQLGDPYLKPEKGWFFDLGLRSWNSRFNFTADGFLNLMDNLIVEDSSSFIYSYSQNPGVSDTLFAFQNANVEKAILLGGDLSFNAMVLNNLHLSGTLTYVYGEDRKNEKALPAIPPLNGSLSLRYILPAWGSLSVGSRFAGKQDRIAAGETATGGYAVYDLALRTAAFGWKKVKLEGTAGADNLFNRPYRLHLSTLRGSILNEPARSFYLRMNILF